MFEGDINDGAFLSYLCAHCIFHNQECPRLVKRLVACLPQQSYMLILAVRIVQNFLWNVE